MRTDYRLKIILAFIAAALIAMLNFDPFGQDPGYHRFADQRRILGIANFFNVASNLLLIVTGHMGVRFLLTDEAKRAAGNLAPVYFTFFAGVWLTGFGSAFYHYHPDNQSLLWDRLPMTIDFMAFFCIVVGECISDRLAKRLLGPLLLIGFFSVIYWQATEQAGRGDLRLYVLIQFLPMLLIPLILRLFDPEAARSRPIWHMLGVYLLAKIAESYDREIYNLSGWLSGHTVKHALLAAGILIIYRWLRSRSTGESARTA